MSAHDQGQSPAGAPAPAQVTIAGLHRFDARRLAALVRKENLQALRDPSTLLIAFVLPAVLLFLFAYAVSLDIRKVRIGVVVESTGASAQQLAAAFAATGIADFRAKTAEFLRKLRTAAHPGCGRPAEFGAVPVQPDALGH